MQWSHRLAQRIVEAANDDVEEVGRKGNGRYTSREVFYTCTLRQPARIIELR